MSAASSHKRNLKHRFLSTGCVLLLACCCSCASPTDSASPPAGAQTKERSTSIPAKPEGSISPRQDDADARAQPLSALERGTEAFESVVNLSGGRQFATHTIEKRLTRTKFVVEADYPQLTGDGSMAARNFNQAAYALVTGDLKPYLKDGRDLEKERHAHWKDVEEHHTISHRVIFASDAVISVLFYAEGYSWGAAHGYHYPLVLNYDLTRGRVLKLADLFKPGAQYLQTIAAHCVDDLSRQLDTTPARIREWSDRATPALKNYRAWVLTPAGLVIIFEEYQVTSYAGGEPKVLLPYERLGEIINPRGVLASLAAPAG
ncbi:MAG TPA: RsiV family protein [Pyrinomonadaceae bacterium]|jgi:hypothetical protein